MINLTKTQSITNNKTESIQFPKQYDMIVFCHLRWQFVYQRPQHIISRLSTVKNVLLIEEPIKTDSKDTGNIIVVSDKLHVLQPNY